MPSRTMPPLRFGAFEFDRGTGELRRSGFRVRLQPQAARVLTALVERPGCVISREGLRPALEGYLRGSVAYLDREGSEHRVPPERFALLHAALGESVEAIDWLSRAADQRSPALLTALVDPQLDAVRTDPRFVGLALRVGSKAAIAGGRPLLGL